ncbi:MAG TPA: hypothetical protein VF691_02990 [Cytophagaceae bacterium]
MFVFFNKIIVISFLVLLANYTVAQTGPGGVGDPSSNKIWLDASENSAYKSGDPVTIFSDRSGNLYNFSQSGLLNAPSFLKEAINGRSAIHFDRTKALQYLEVTAPGIGDLMSNSHSIFAIAKANTGSLNIQNVGILQAIVSAEGLHSGLFFEGYPNTISLNFQQWTSNHAGLSVRYPQAKNGDWYLMNKNCIEQGSNVELKGYCSGSEFGVTGYQAPMFNYHNQLRLGTSRNNIGAQHAWPLNGDIAEVIIYNISLNNAQRIIVENYLSSKYNLPTANDYYVNNLSNYTYDVQGIGTTDGTVANKHSYSASSKELLLAEMNGSLDSPNEFVFAGHSGIDNNYIETDLPSSVDKRWSRIWYLEKSTASSLEISVSFKLPSTEIIDPAKEYCLLFRPENSGSFNLIKNEGKVLQPTLKDGVVSFALSMDNSSIGNLKNGYYTLGVKPKGTTEIGSNNYNLLSPDKQASFPVVASGALRFSYDEAYKSDVLTYSIYNYRKTMVANLPVLTKQYGDNFCTIDLLDKGLIKGAVYTLEVKGEKNSKYYLTFRYEDQ